MTTRKPVPEAAAPDEPRGDHDAPPFDRAAALDLLATGELELVGRLVNASNATFYCTVTRPESATLSGLTAGCVYKPIRGEAPLWDFPIGTLGHRELAAHALSEALGWEIVPPTVFREGPFGEGMVQIWIDTDESVDLVGRLGTDDPALRRVAVFDLVANNADRKVGHLLPVPGGHVYGVDHGICFAIEPKLRTVLWGWRGRPLLEEEVDALAVLRTAVDGELGAALEEHLSTREIRATRRRIDSLLSDRLFPEPDPSRPAVPWPPF